MSKVLANIQSRHSTRDFLSTPVSKEILSDIAVAGKSAPTASNAQTRILTVVTNPELIKRTYTAVRHATGRDESYCMYNPAALIICAEEESNANGIANCACAMQNMMLAAQNLGVGSVWINQIKDNCHHPEVRSLLDDLSIPASHVAWALLALGNPSGPVTPPKKEGLLITWFE
jgi:Nitroreductase